MAKPAAPKSNYADSVERLGALVLDLLLLSFAIPAFAPAMPDFGPFIRVIPPLVFLAYFAGLPLTPLQGTPGKRIVGIKICGPGGRRLGWLASLARTGAAMCWITLLALALGSDLPVLSDDAVKTAILMTMFLPWVPMAILPRRQSLFDLLAGTMVVRYKADEAGIAQEVPGKPRVLEGLGVVVVCILAGGVFSIIAFTMQDKDRRARVVYAIEETKPLREKIGEFRKRQGRWPRAADLGIPEFTPFRAGGGYRVQPDGSILISFSVLKELKGHEVIQRPVATAGDGKIEWQCSADTGLNMKYLPPSCREAAR